MDWLTFIAEMFKAAAWPTTVVVIIILIRKPLAELIPLLRKLKWKELELEFEEKLTAVEKQAAEVLPTPKPQPHDVSESFPPRARILKSWLSVEAAALRALNRRDPSVPRDNFLHFPATRSLLGSLQILNKQQLAVFDSLRDLRNQAAHFDKFLISKGDAESYEGMASSLVQLLDSA